MTESPKPQKKKKAKHYLNNGDMLIEWKLSNEKGYMTDKFGRMIMLLTKRYSSKMRFNVCDSFREDMESYALMIVAKVWRSFNPEKSNNPFAYFTQVVTRAFYQFQNSERVQRNITNELNISAGQSPSHAYMVEYEYQNMDMDELSGNVSSIPIEEYEES